MLKLNIQKFAGEDGSVVIKIKADSKQFDKDLVDIQKRMYELTEKAKKPIEIDGVKVSGGWNLSKEEQKEYDEIYAQLDEINNKEIERIENERQITQELQNQKEAKAESNLISNEENIKVSELRAKLSELVGIYRDIEKQDVVDSKDLEYANNLKQEIIQIKKELEKITGSKISIKGITDVENNFNGIKKSVDNIGNSITGVTKKVARWGLAVFGIRSIYLGIRQAVSQIMQEDENLKYQIEYMKFAVGQAIKPVVEWIVNLVHQILVGVGAIIKILFGINIFSNATAKNFQKANTNAKKLQKTLTGFDEMNVLNEDGSTGVGIKINNALKDFGDISKQVEELAGKLKPFEDEIKAIALIAAGIFGAKMIGNMVSGIGTLIGSKGLGKLGSKLGSLAAIAGGIIITGIIAKKVWDELGELSQELDEIGKKGQEQQKKWIEGEENFNKLINTGNANRTSGYKLLKKTGGVYNWLNGLGQRNLENARRVSENMSVQIDKEMKLYNEKKLTTEQEKTLIQNIKEQIVYNNEVIEALRREGKSTSEIEDLNKKLNTQLFAVGNQISWNKDMTNQWAFENENVRIGYDGTVEVLKDLKNIKIDDKKFNVEANVKPAERGLVGLIASIKDAMQGAFNSINLAPILKGLQRVTNIADKMFPGLNFNEQFNRIRKAVGLAKGGIVSLPGRGVPIGGAVAGETGRMEGVFPLTDSQQMELLGEAIGRYININLTNITELDGRQIARKVDKIQQNNNFVLNR